MPTMGLTQMYCKSFLANERFCFDLKFHSLLLGAWLEFETSFSACLHSRIMKDNVFPFFVRWLFLRFVPMMDEAILFPLFAAAAAAAMAAASMAISWVDEALISNRHFVG